MASFFSRFSFSSAQRSEAEVAAAALERRDDAIVRINAFLDKIGRHGEYLV